MQLRNLSGTEVPRALWRKIANAMQLGGELPQSRSGEWPIYYDGRTLRVTVNRRTPRHFSTGQVTCGAYAIGNIYLYPCPKCTTGFLTHVFLHEICHAWLDAFYRSLSFSKNACIFADQFADEAYRILGGTRPAEMKCWKCELPAAVSTERVLQLERYAASLPVDNVSTVEKALAEAERTAREGGIPPHGKKMGFSNRD